jgi:hypothetical protein
MRSLGFFRLFISVLDFFLFIYFDTYDLQGSQRFFLFFVLDLH